MYYSKFTLGSYKSCTGLLIAFISTFRLFGFAADFDLFFTKLLVFFF